MFGSIFFCYTVKSVLSGHSKKDKTMVLNTNGSLMETASNLLPNALLEHSAILLTCNKLLPVLKTKLWSSL